MELPISENWLQKIKDNPDIIRMNPTLLRRVIHGSLNDLISLAPYFKDAQDNKQWALFFVHRLTDQGRLEKIRAILPALTLDEFFECGAAFDALQGKNMPNYIESLSHWVSEQKPSVRDKHQMYMRYYLMASTLDFAVVLPHLNAIKAPADVYSHLEDICENAISILYVPDQEESLEKQIKLLHFGWNIQYPYSLLLLQTKNEERVWRNFDPLKTALNYSTFNEDLELAKRIKRDSIGLSLVPTKNDLRNQFLYEFYGEESLIRHCVKPNDNVEIIEPLNVNVYDFNP